MEISKTADSVKIKLKKMTIVIDPTKKAEAEVVIATNGNPPKEYFDEYPLVIEGPGEYEKNGVYIRGQKTGDFTSYEIMDGGGKMHFTTTESLEKLKDESDVEVVLIRATGKVDESIFSAFSSSVLVLYNAGAEVVLDSETIKKMNKVNLKNREEFRGTVIMLDA